MWNTKEIKSFNKTESHAFKVIITTNSNGNLSCEVTPGTINNIMPSNIISGGGLAKFSLNKNAFNYIILTANTDGKSIVSATIEVKSSTIKTQKPLPFGLPTSFEVLIAVTYNSQAFQCITSNISRGGILQYIESKSNTEPGTLPYTAYFIWG
jgi:hypothetical protein